MPRRRPPYEPASGHQTMEGPGVDRFSRHKGNLDPQSILPRVAEEAPGAYKNVTAVVDAADEAGLSKKVAKLEPMICVKG